MVCNFIVFSALVQWTNVVKFYWTDLMESVTVERSIQDPVYADKLYSEFEGRDDSDGRGNRVFDKANSGTVF